MKLKQIRSYFTVGLVAMSMAIGLSSALSTPSLAANCGEVETAVLPCDPPRDKVYNDESGEGINPIYLLLTQIIQIMTAGVGIVAVGGLVYGGVLYASAADSAEKVSKAKDIIRNVVIGVVAYIAMAGILNFLIPGGIFQ